MHSRMPVPSPEPTSHQPPAPSPQPPVTSHSDSHPPSLPQFQSLPSPTRPSSHSRLLSSNCHAIDAPLPPAAQRPPAHALPDANPNLAPNRLWKSQVTHSTAISYRIAPPDTKNSVCVEIPSQQRPFSGKREIRRHLAPTMLHPTISASIPGNYARTLRNVLPLPASI